jgi:hypothetical protein
MHRLSRRDCRLYPPLNINAGILNKYEMESTMVPLGTRGACVNRQRSTVKEDVMSIQNASHRSAWCNGSGATGMFGFSRYKSKFNINAMRLDLVPRWYAM